MATSQLRPLGIGVFVIPVRITTQINPFNAYINSTDDFLQADVPPAGPTKNWQRLLLPQADADEWHAKRLYWRDTLFPLYSNPATSTKFVKKDVQDFIEEFREFGNPVLDKIAAGGAATNTDAGIFNFVLDPDNPSTPTTSIDGEVSVVVKHKGGGIVDFKCTSSEGKAKAEGSDSVQMAWMIIEEEGPVPPAPGEESFPDPDSTAMTKEVFTKSHFEKHFGVANLKKRVVIYFRWWNTKHPDLAGPWTEVMAVVIA